MSMFQYTQNPALDSSVNICPHCCSLRLSATVMFPSFAQSLCPSTDNLSGGVHLNLSHLLPHYQNKISKIQYKC